MQQADVVLYDNLVSPEIMALVGPRRSALRRQGAEPPHDAPGSDQRPDADLARGAPCCGPGAATCSSSAGGEEIETLSAHDVRFQVVPGITAAAGVAAYAGIPLTHRDHAHACVLVTGHLRDGTMNLDWPALARPGQTLVCYMGFQGLAELCAKLAEHGLADSTPAAIVQQGTQRSQRVVTGTLRTLPELAARARLAPPTLIIVGDVVRCATSWKWFERTQEVPAAARGEVAA